VSDLTVTLSREQLAELADMLAERLRQPQRERWLATNDAATYLGCHPVTLRRLAAEGRIPSVQTGTRGRRRFKVSDLDTWRGR
jgi:excisionase family DNA binding protein